MTKPIGSPSSIFAKRDWLDHTVFARSVCVYAKSVRQTIAARVSAS